MKIRINRLMIAGALMGIGVSAVMAERLSPSSALDRVLTDAPHAIRAAGNGKYKLADTRLDRAGEVALYLFETGGNGWILVSAESNVTPLLGYGMTSRRDASGNYAPGFEYWMNTLTEQIECASQRTVNPVIRERRADFEPIAPLCTTTWNQGDPYYNECPEQGGKHCYTGCVATAMAQAMNYHQWPDKGEKSHAYTWSGKTLQINFEKTPLRWDLMLDDYETVDASKTEIRAVTSLMKACGYSVNMNYSTSGSGATSISIAPALAEYFKYDKGMRYEQRDYHYLAEWEALIYDNLKNCGPVIYNGQSQDGGHSFICDGYDEDGYFHFNWGWGGVSDGYFILDALDPINQGIGGSTSAYNFAQDCIIGMRPDRDGTSTYQARLILNDALDIESIDVEPDEEFTVTGLIYNPDPGTFPSGRLGLRFTPVDGGEPLYTYGLIGEVPTMMGFDSYTLPLPEGLTPGYYEVVSVYAEDEWDGDALISEGEWQVTPVPVFSSQSMLCEYKDGIANFVQNDPAFPEVLDLVVPEVFGQRDEVGISTILKNNDETDIYIQLVAILIDDNYTLAGDGMRMVYDIAPGETVQVDYRTEFRYGWYLVPPGDYKLCLASATNTHYLPISDMIPVKVTEKSEIVPINSEYTSIKSEYFDMQGRKVVAPGAGVYIRVDHDTDGVRKMSKVIF